MRPLIALSLAALAAACSSEPSIDLTNASGEDVMNKVEAAGPAISMRAGRWEGTISIKAAATGLPGGDTARRSNAEPIKICVTPDQLKARNNPLMAQAQTGCRYDHFRIEGGRIDAAMTCQRQGVTLKSTMKGEISSDAYKLNSTAEMAGAGAGALSGLKSETTFDVRRTGDCRGDEDRA